MTKKLSLLLLPVLLGYPIIGHAQTAPEEGPVPEWMGIFNEVLALNVLEISVWRVAAFLLILIVGLFLKNYVVGRLTGRLDTLLTKTKTNLDNELLTRVREPLQWLLFVVAGYFALIILQLPEGIHRVSVLVLQTIGTVLVAWMLFRAIDVLTMALDSITSKTENDMDDHIVPLVGRVLRVILVAVAIITIIQQWGYDVTSLIAGLGIGGLALALAAQDTLGNWFGGVMIFTDRPFKPGDWVKSSKFGEGVVEDVGLRSTKVRTFAETLITVPNKDVAAGAVENFSEMTKRRIKTTIGLEYRTTPTQMREVLANIRTLLTEHPEIEQGTFIVHMVSYGDSSLNVLLYAFTTTTVWTEWLQAREDIYLGIMDIVQEAGTGFAFPSQSLYFENPLELPDKAA